MTARAFYSLKSTALVYRLVMKNKRFKTAIITSVMNRDKYAASLDRREISALNSVAVHT